MRLTLCFLFCLNIDIIKKRNLMADRFYIKHPWTLYIKFQLQCPKFIDINHLNMGENIVEPVGGWILYFIYLMWSINDNDLIGLVWYELNLWYNMHVPSSVLWFAHHWHTFIFIVKRAKLYIHTTIAVSVSPRMDYVFHLPFEILLDVFLGSDKFRSQHNFYNMLVLGKDLKLETCIFLMEM